MDQDINTDENLYFALAGEVNEALEIEQVNNKHSGDRLKLIKRGNHYEITVNGVFLMGTHGGYSEKKVIEESLFYIDLHKMNARHSGYRFLIAGLGVGYSLLSAVGDSRVKRVDVVELYQEIIDWNYKYFSPYNHRVIKDSKVHLIHEDIYAYLQCLAAGERRSNFDFTSIQYDLIVMDVDNGPDWLVTQGNEKIYHEKGLRMAKNCLTHGGALVIWSITENQKLIDALMAVFDWVFIKTYCQKDEKGRTYKDRAFFSINV